MNATRIRLGAVVLGAVLVLPLYALSQAPHGPRAAQGGANTWVMGGPEGTAVRALAIDAAEPCVLYAGTPVGVSRSSDSGRTWDHVLDNPQVNVLAVGSRSPGIVYAGTGLLAGNRDSSGGIMKSVDGGRSWRSVNSGLPSYVGSPRVRALAVDPARPEVLYAALSTPGLFKSTDSGQSWVALEGLGHVVVSDVAVDGSEPDTLFAATYRGVFRSFDAGRSWSQASAGLPAGDYGGRLGSIRIDPSRPGTLYAAAGDWVWDGADAFLYSSDDRGATWRRIGEGLSGRSGFWRVSDLAIDPKDSSTLYASIAYWPQFADWMEPARPGLFVSRDDGESWAPVEEGPRASIEVLEVHPETPSALFAGTSSDGLFRSTDRGASWKVVNAGLPKRSVDCLVISPRTPSIHLAVAAGRLFTSRNRGVDWSEAGAFPGCPFIDPSSPDTMYVPSASLVLKTTDGGATWSTLDIGLTAEVCANGCGISAFAVDPRAPLTLYAGAWSKPRIDRQAEGLFRSVDGGQSWSRLWGRSLDSGFTVTSLLIDPQTSTVYAGTGRGIWRFNAGPGAPDCGMRGLSWYLVLGLSIDLSRPSSLYATMPDGLFRCTGTEGWTAASEGLPSQIAPDGLARWCLGTPSIDPEDAGRLYVTECGEGLFRSTDGGESWSPFDPPLRQGLGARIVVDPQDPSILYALTRAGIFRLRQRPM